MLNSQVIICISTVLLYLVQLNGEITTWAVLVGTSRYWHNYRHLANVMAMYGIVKDMGMVDEHVLVMIASDAACDSRNSHPADVVVGPGNRGKGGDQLFKADAEIDYRGLDVSVASFTEVMTGRHSEHTPSSARLDSNSEAHVLLYMTGHGGDGFLKFHDVEEMTAEHVARIVNDMAVRGRYRELLVLVDTCQADTLFKLVTAPRVTVLSSSLLGENSYAYNVNTTMAVPPSDRFTLAVQKYFNKIRDSGRGLGNLSVQDLAAALDPAFLGSTATLWSSPGTRAPSEILLSDFFAPARSSTAGGASQWMSMT